MTFESDTALLVAQKELTDAMMQRFGQLKSWQDRYVLIKRYSESISDDVKQAHNRIFQTPTSWNELEMLLKLLKDKVDEENSKKWFNLDYLKVISLSFLMGL